MFPETFSDRVRATWLSPLKRLDRIVDTDGLVIAVDPALPENRRLTFLHLDAGPILATVSPGVGRMLGEHLGEDPDAAAFHHSLTAAGLRLHGADEVFYFAADTELALLASGNTDGAEAAAGSDPDAEAVVRLLESADAEAFAAFQAANSEADLDEAFVELDHAFIVGAIIPATGEIAAAASAYQWDDHPVADIGVLTAPGHRGRGHGRRVVRALARELLGAGFSPQYRCQADNHASRATAAAAGLTRFGSWDVIAQD